MNAALKKYVDDLSPDELDFLVRKVAKQERTLKRILWIMMGGAIVFAFGGAWENKKKEPMMPPFETVFSWQNYFITLGLLLIIFTLILRLLRHSELQKLKKDIRQKKKIIERVLIQKKTFLPHNNTFHFYLDSLSKISIQVSEDDFMQMDEGDEICIEYSQNAEVYFGYF